MLQNSKIIPILSEFKKKCHTKFEPRRCCETILYRKKCVCAKVCTMNVDDTAMFLTSSSSIRSFQECMSGHYGIIQKVCHSEKSKFHCCLLVTRFLQTSGYFTVSSIYIVNFELTLFSRDTSGFRSTHLADTRSTRLMIRPYDPKAMGRIVDYFQTQSAGWVCVLGTTLRRRHRLLVSKPSETLMCISCPLSFEKWFVYHRKMNVFQNVVPRVPAVPGRYLSQRAASLNNKNR